MVSISAGTLPIVKTPISVPSTRPVTQVSGGRSRPTSGVSRRGSSQASFGVPPLATTVSAPAVSSCGGTLDSECSLSCFEGSACLLAQTRRKRPGSGRFHPVELVCFKKLPTPSPFFSQCGIGGLDSGPEENGVSAVDVPNTPLRCTELNGDSTDESSPLSKATLPVIPPLALEETTASVLDQIFPVAPFADIPLNRSSSRTVFLSKRSFASTTEAEKSTQVPAGSNRDLMLCMRVLLEKFQTVRKALDFYTVAESLAFSREVSRKQFIRFLGQHLPSLKRAVLEGVFSFLDKEKTGFVLFSDFFSALEAATPVRTIFDLRRKLIALGHPVMRNALTILGWTPEEKGSKKYLTLDELGLALRMIGIEDVQEHRSIFFAVQEWGDLEGKISFDQLLAALAAVSPPLLLEDLRDRMIRRFGSLEEAYAQCPEGDCLPRRVFCHWVVQTFRFSVVEASKIYDRMDFTRSSKLTRREILTVLRLVEPGLYLEDLRKRVLQRLWSINDAIVDLAEAKMALPPHCSAATVNLAPTTLEEVLRKVDLTQAEIALLAGLIDIDGNRTLMVSDLVLALKVFVSSSELLEIRVLLLGRFRNTTEPFEAALGRDSKDARLDEEGLDRILRDLKVSSTPLTASAVFDLVEVRSGKGVLIRDVCSALRGMDTGAQVPLTAEQRDVRARQQIRGQLGAIRRDLGDMRCELRLPPSAQRAKAGKSYAADVDDGKEDYSGGDGRCDTGFPSQKALMKKHVDSKMKLVKELTSKVKAHDSINLSSTKSGAVINAKSDQVFVSYSVEHRLVQHNLANKHRLFLATDAPLYTC